MKKLFKVFVTDNLSEMGRYLSVDTYANGIYFDDVPLEELYYFWDMGVRYEKCVMATPYLVVDDDEEDGD